jgi:hypothetical protein
MSDVTETRQPRGAPNYFRQAEQELAERDARIRRAAEEGGDWSYLRSWAEHEKASRLRKAMLARQASAESTKGILQSLAVVLVCGALWWVGNVVNDNLTSVGRGYVGFGLLLLLALIGPCAELLLRRRRSKHPS